jgi:drug/metabolite transporter (DMT)-like permease
MEKPAEGRAERPIAFYLAALALAAFMWGTSFPAVKLVAGAFEPMTLAALRGIIGAATLIAIFLLIGERLRPKSRREVFDWVVLGAVNGWIANLLLAFALKALPSGQAAMIQSCGPLITAIAASMLFADERLTIRRIIGIALGFTGVAMLVWPKLAAGGGTPLAALAMLGVAACYASGNIFTRALREADPKRLAFGQQTMSALFAAVLALLLHGPVSFAPAIGHWAIVLWLGVIGTGLPILIFMYVIRAIGPTRASLTGYMVPAWAALLSALVLGEAFGWREGLAGAIILAGVFIASTRR